MAQNYMVGLAPCIAHSFPRLLLLSSILYSQQTNHHVAVGRQTKLCPSEVAYENLMWGRVNP